MKALFVGGMKSGKSNNAERYILELCEKPIYIATTEIFDDELILRVREHQSSRSNSFTTIEEPLKLYETIKAQNRAVLIECLSMWINNMLHYGFTREQITSEVKDILALKQSMVFVLNDVSSSIIPENALAREFITINGEVGGIVASHCDEVYSCIVQICSKIK
ncbi:MAG: bifunctional adenosylcobinamide kinase/adenosylcobinamide-phosphate guanylyltransferase [Campylobacterota bacterium]|nr:bifunctional adenosylcobinamide kinase/adenosylcobinamide-phosphate guanylyltransferase [Campylobacterota bacterium]